MELVKFENIGSSLIAATTSLRIAEFTGKEHKNVIRDIESLIDSGKLGQLNFELSNYKTSQGKLMPMYILDEKFTTILLMGFTGEKALDWKIAYQEQFEAMRNNINKAAHVRMHPVDEFEKYHKLAGILGLEKEQAAIHANYATRKITGSDVLALIEYKPSVESKTQSITNWIKEFDLQITPVKANRYLLELGYLTGAPGNWLLSESGKSHGKLVTQEAGGKMRESIEWSKSVAEILRGMVNHKGI
jgi:Rha family phage regulatory protein